MNQLKEKLQEFWTKIQKFFANMYTETPNKEKNEESSWSVGDIFATFSFGSEPGDVIHVIATGGIQFGTQVPQGFLGNVLGEAGEDRDPVADLFSAHAQDVVVCITGHIGFHIDQDVPVAVFVQEQAIFWHITGNGSK